MASINLGTGRNAKLEGVPELERAIKDLGSKVNGKRLKKVLMHAAMLCRNMARDLAPEDTGLLKQNIVAAYGRGGKGDEANVIVTVKYGKGHANHAHLLEFGTSKMPAKPFLRPAAQIAKPMMVGVIADGFKEIIDEADNK